ncbi:hypothetical protein [Novosphingobium sp.]|uniref:hypothetical protein n=1 Tax=Novosphingobium sp. TaxID=1874826 RepID=UPI0028B0A52D|nr:hypothetical protein [Novosphingobium sp.]
MKMITTLTASAALACMIAACDGPREKAGAAKDEAEAKAAGLPYEGTGPGERAGKAADRIDRATAKAREAQADALEDEGHVIQAKADAQADKLEAQAESIRKTAEQKVKSLRGQAGELREQR